MGARHIKLKRFIIIFVYHFVITIIRRVWCIVVIFVFFGVVLVVILGQKSTNAPYFASKNRGKRRISAFFLAVLGVCFCGIF